ncbi:MAG: nucleotide sugar dehydrogenase [Chlamydiia bacterium]|nr:nucleotide sugar dehydrogenase [Chlamydiia bacterium]
MKIQDNFPDRRVCIVGLGFVGLTLAAVMAEIGFHVVGVEKREDLLSKIKLGHPGFYEPGLEKTLKKAIKNKNIEFHQEITDDVSATVYIITVGTPINANNEICLTSISSICEVLATKIEDGDLVILRSTVKLGATRNLVLPILRRSGKSFQLAFCPERTVEGQALSELYHLPQVIGTEDFATSVRASQLFQLVTPTTIRLPDYETAEMVKLIDNTKRDVLFAFSNEVAKICDEVGICANKVISAGRFGYSRTNLPIPGPVGGPCLSKDPHILIQSLRDHSGLIPEITAAARSVNESQPKYVVSFLKSLTSTMKDFPDAPNISLLGIAFKGIPQTDDVRGTTARPIFDELKIAFPSATFWGYDALVDHSTIQEFGLKPKDNLASAFSGAHLVLILNNHPMFSHMEIETLTLNMAPPGIVYDFWNCFTDELSLPKNINYLSLGNHKSFNRELANQKG